MADKQKSNTLSHSVTCQSYGHFSPSVQRVILAQHNAITIHNTAQAQQPTTCTIREMTTNIPPTQHTHAHCRNTKKGMRIIIQITKKRERERDFYICLFHVRAVYLPEVVFELCCPRLRINPLAHPS